jgi:hypothetical protein
VFHTGVVGFFLLISCGLLVHVVAVLVLFVGFFRGLWDERVLSVGSPFFLCRQILKLACASDGCGMDDA